jgi:hypothetical protein
VPSEDSDKDSEKLASVHRTEGISFALPALTSSRLWYARSARRSRKILVLRLSAQRSATHLSEISCIDDVRHEDHLDRFRTGKSPDYVIDTESGFFINLATPTQTNRRGADLPRHWALTPVTTTKGDRRCACTWSKPARFAYVVNSAAVESLGS